MDLRQLLEITEWMDNKWAQEIVHEELARRVAFVRTRKDPRKSQARFLEIGLEELRERSRKYDNVCEFAGQQGVDTCLMCQVRPGLKGSTVLK